MSDGKVNILIVDDRPEKLLALEAVLEDLRQNIVRAYSGREALRALLNDDFAVILLDVNMPGMDGFETASLVRQRKSSEHIPIIFITAFGDQDHAARGYSLGAVDYIQTPVVPDVLKTKVAVFVDLYRKTEQVRRQAQWLQQRASQLHRLTAASLAINSALSIEKMLRVITDTAREIVGAHRASTTVIADGNWQHGTTVVSASEKWSAWPQGAHRPEGNGIESLVCATNKTARMTQRELSEHPVWQLADPATRPWMRGWLAAPLTGRDGRNLGLIEASDKADGDFTDDDEALLVQLSQMASIAIENTFFAEERQANRIKDEFLSTLSHELRTPLNAIMGWTQLLRMQQTHVGGGGNGAAPSQQINDDVAHAIDVIDRNARAQAKLVEDLLDVSRVTSGKLRLAAKVVDLSTIVECAVEAVRPNAEAKSVALSVTNDGGGEHCIDGDPDRLQQVVWNLLSNAVKFTPAGGRVDVILDEVAGQHRLRVADTGQGINAAFLPYVFDRFRQADSTSTRTHGGLGIGLTIVRHIVTMHGGSVSAESAGEGRGSTFNVMLPRVAASAEAAAPADCAPAKGAAGAGAGNANGDAARPGGPADSRDIAGTRVLLIDDEPDAREVVGEILRRAGAHVTTSGSVTEAMGALRESIPDVILSDIAMPDQDGYDFLRRLRELPERCGGKVSVIALTAYAREEDRMRALSAGFAAHVAKPVSPDQILSTIARLIARDRPAALADLKCG